MPVVAEAILIFVQGECAAPTNSHSDERDCQCSSAVPETSSGTSGNSENWMVLSIAGEKPAPRFNVRYYWFLNKFMLINWCIGVCTCFSAQSEKFNCVMNSMQRL